MVVNPLACGPSAAVPPAAGSTWTWFFWPISLGHLKEQSRLSLGNYGRPRMTEELRAVGVDMGLFGHRLGAASSKAIAVSQYCSHDDQKVLRENGLKTSISGKGNCHDSTAAALLFKTIKAEQIWRRTWKTRRQTETAIFQYINGFYNLRRRHSALRGKIPLAFDRQVT